MRWSIAPLGDAALIVRVGDSLGEVLSAARRLRAARLPGAAEIVPAFASVAVFLESPAFLPECAQAIPGALARKARGHKTKPRLIEVPVCYAAEFAPDLADVARHCGLTAEEVIAAHSAARYEVRCVGFTPGYPYLRGLPATLTTPRRASPRQDVPAGSVAIAGELAGIYPLASPGGWNLIGRTPLRLFDPAREPAALFAPGDRLRFVAIDRMELTRWEK